MKVQKVGGKYYVVGADGKPVNGAPVFTDEAMATNWIAQNGGGAPAQTPSGSSSGAPTVGGTSAATNVGGQNYVPEAGNGGPQSVMDLLPPNVANFVSQIVAGARNAEASRESSGGSSGGSSKPAAPAKPAVRTRAEADTELGEEFGENFVSGGTSAPSYSGPPSPYADLFPAIEDINIPEGYVGSPEFLQQQNRVQLAFNPETGQYGKSANQIAQDVAARNLAYIREQQLKARMPGAAASTPIFDRGGSMAIRRPATIIDDATGQPLGRLAQTGPERAAFSGVNPGPNDPVSGARAPAVTGSRGDEGGRGRNSLSFFRMGNQLLGMPANQFGPTAGPEGWNPVGAGMNDGRDPFGPIYGVGGPNTVGIPSTSGGGASSFQLGSGLPNMGTGLPNMQSALLDPMILRRMFGNRRQVRMPAVA